MKRRNLLLGMLVLALTFGITAAALASEANSAQNSSSELNSGVVITQAQQRICSTCNGSGSVNGRTTWIQGVGWVTERVTCPSCRGRGIR